MSVIKLVIMIIRQLVHGILFGHMPRSNFIILNIQDFILKVLYHVALNRENIIHYGFWAHPPDGQPSAVLLHSVVIIVVHVSRQSKN